MRNDKNGTSVTYESAIKTPSQAFALLKKLSIRYN